MDKKGEDLEARMEERLRELEIKWSDVLHRTGLSRQALLDIRNGSANPRPNTRRKIERALDLAPGGFEQMQRGEKPTPQTADQPAAERSTEEAGDLAPLDEVLSATAKGLATLARMYAWYKARQENRDPDPADEDRFLVWALKVRQEQRDIEPSEAEGRDVS